MSEQILTKILDKLESMDNRLGYLETKVDNIQGQLEENTSILRALEHASQVNAAEMEGLKLNTSTKESIERLDAKFEVLNKRLFEQEVELRLIKKAQ